ncbi:MAG: uracil-DNA glycosylase [Aigarchaeota archaeon]|nr:uracil-DNA glycosylase [Aigarchaeota archaeon]
MRKALPTDIPDALETLSRRIVACHRCSRLRRYCARVARERKRQFRSWTYWGKPVPGFGDPRAELLVVGLAPAAHGSNRTGRMFTGDRSGNLLVATLHRHGFASIATSEHIDDGLQLRRAYLTAAVRCAPPQNNPTRNEIANCSEYLARELEILDKARVVLTLGRIAFESYLHAITQLDADLELKGFRFKHGALHNIGETRHPFLLASYHPSPQNTQTGRLTPEMWDSVFDSVARLIAKNQ